MNNNQFYFLSVLLLINISLCFKNIYLSAIVVIISIGFFLLGRQDTKEERTIEIAKKLRTNHLTSLAVKDLSIEQIIKNNSLIEIGNKLINIHDMNYPNISGNEDFKKLVNIFEEIAREETNKVDIYKGLLDENLKKYYNEFIKNKRSG